MTGQITGVTTLNGTTGIFGTISTTNNTNVGAPTNGVYGGTGDKLILWAGVAGTSLPYSLGINASTLWYSVPTGATHKFYSGGGNPKMTILGSGNIGIGTETPSELLYIYALAGNNAIQSLDSSAGSGLAILRLISGNATTNRGSFLDFYNNFASTSVPRWRIVNNYDYDTKNDLRIVNGNTQATLTILQNGNIGIGINNPTELLNLYTSGTNNAFLKIDAVGGTGQAGLRLFAGSGTTNRATRIDFFNNVSSTTSARWSILNDTDQNGTNDLRFYNAGGITNVFTILQNGRIGIGITNPFEGLCIGNPLIASDGTLVISKNSGGNRNFKMGFDTDFNFCIGDYGNNVINNQWKPTNFNINWNSGNVGINVAATSLIEKLYVNGDTTINGILKLKNSDWHKSIDGANRLYFANNTFTQYGNGGGVLGHVFLNNSSGNILELYNDNTAQFNNNVRFTQYITSKCYDSFGEDFSFIVNWNGTANSGWFVGLNRFWYTGHTCLNVSILPYNAGGLQNICWFGRVYLSYSAGGGTGVPPATSGGVIQIVTDFRNPASSSPSNYYIQVGERWDGSGNNALFIQVNNPVYAGIVHVKIRG